MVPVLAVNEARRTCVLANACLSGKSLLSVVWCVIQLMLIFLWFVIFLDISDSQVV